MEQKTAVIFQSHLWSNVHALRFERLRRDLAGQVDCYILFDSAADAETRAAVSLYSETRFFAADELQRTLGYSFFSERGLVPGSQHFPLIEFSRRHDYERYWLIESDVEFSGNWASLLTPTASSDAALISSHVRPYAAAASYIWWRTLVSPADVPLNEGRNDWRTAALLPVTRFSAGALRAIDQAHQDGWRGHSEVMIPSVLRQQNLEIADLNQFGTLYLPPTRDLAARTQYLGSMRWRPSISLNEFARSWAPSTIYHPVKQAWTSGPEGVTREHRGRLKFFPLAKIHGAASS